MPFSPPPTAKYHTEPTVILGILKNVKITIISNRLWQQQLPKGDLK